MIYVDDLIRGLLDLADAPQNMLYEPCRGYALPGPGRPSWTAKYT